MILTMTGLCKMLTSYLLRDFASNVGHCHVLVQLQGHLAG
jgi:hypothetical protein